VKIQVKQLSADKSSATIEIDGKQSVATAGEIESAIAALGKLRYEMTPEVPRELSPTARPAPRVRAIHFGFFHNEVDGFEIYLLSPDLGVWVQAVLTQEHKEQLSRLLVKAPRKRPAGQQH
jgi:hypothetical protein